MNKKKQQANLRNAQKRELERLKLEVLELEAEIKKQKKFRFKNLNIRNFKYFKSLCNFSFSYIIGASLVVSAAKVVGGGFPFVKDDILKYKKYSLDYQTDGIINADCYYDGLDIGSDNRLRIYSPWILNEEGLYERTLKTYKVGELESTELYDAILNKDLDYIEQNFKYEEEIQVSNKVYLPNNEYVLEAEICFFDKDDTLKAKESDFMNIMVTSIDIVGILVAGTVIAKNRKFKLKMAFRKINEEYKEKLKNIEILKEKLDDDKKMILSLTNKNNDR